MPESSSQLALPSGHQPCVNFSSIGIQLPALQVIKACCSPLWSMVGVTLSSSAGGFAYIPCVLWISSGLDPQSKLKDLISSQGQDPITRRWNSRCAISGKDRNRLQQWFSRIAGARYFSLASFGLLCRPIEQGLTNPSIISLHSKLRKAPLAFSIPVPSHVRFDLKILLHCNRGQAQVVAILRKFMACFGGLTPKLLEVVFTSSQPREAKIMIPQGCPWKLQWINN